MKNLFLTLTSIMLFSVANAQFFPTGNLTIFSEDGDKFFLVLNGERQNNVPMTNLRVEDLNQPYFSARIIFEDKNLPDISRNMLAITDADGRYMDVTYRIRKDKSGRPNLRFFSMTPPEPNFIPSPNVQVIHYGAPTQVVVAPPVQQVPVPVTSGTTVTQTTTTTTRGGEVVGANVNIGGINMGVTVVDPFVTGSVTHTTTTTTNAPVVNAVPVPVGCRGTAGMLPADFNAALASIRRQGFDDTRLSTAKQISSTNCLTAAQVAQICRLFSFEETKLDFAKFAYTQCTEPQSYFRVNDVFSFSSSVDELNAFVSGMR
jgi:hypothetical protein